MIGPRGGPLRHPDHLFVRDTVASRLAGRNDVALLLYEELPYLRGAPADREVVAVVRRLGLEAARIEVAIDRHAKARRIAAYRSQIAHLLADGTRLDDPGELPERERYWLLGAGLKVSHA